MAQVKRLITTIWQLRTSNVEQQALVYHWVIKLEPPITDVSLIQTSNTSRRLYCDLWRSKVNYYVL